MVIKIIKIRLGVTCTYLLPTSKGEYVLVDAGEPGLADKFKQVAARRGIDLQSIRLIIITHAHYDHVGSLAEIKKWCDCPVLIHPLEDEILQQAKIVIPPGISILGKVLSYTGKLLGSYMRFPASKGDILVTDRCDLNSFGLDGEVVSTPGHTKGSLSVVLASGDAVVGDLAMNFLGRNNFPIFGDSVEELNQSRSLIRSKGIHTVYPAHGRPFPIEALWEN
ncbi:MAG: MBL fold metallo-hydrolase [Methylocystaceae bacterium]